MTPDEMPPVGALVRQPHGGAIVQGGVPPKSPGRPPNEVRAALRESGFARIHVLEEIADDPKTKPHDRIQAIGLLLEQGLRGNVSIDDLRSAVIRTLEVIQAEAPPDIADMLIKKIRPIWRTGG